MKNSKFLIAVFCLMVFMMAAEASAASYYVAKTGNDANTGTEASPWLTIQKAANTAKAGDTVYVRAGTYVEEVNFPNSGTSGKYIAFRNYGTDIVTLKAPIKTYHGWSTVTPNHHSGQFEIIGKSYIKLKGFVFQGSATSIEKAPMAAITAEQDAHHIIVDGNRFVNLDSGGVWLAGYYGTNYTTKTWNLEFINNYVSYKSSYDTKRNLGGGNEIISFDHVSYANVSYNTFEDLIGCCGIDFKNGGGNGIISYNKIKNIRWYASSNAWTGYKSIAIYIDGYKYGLNNISVFNNFVDSASGIQVGSECGGLVQNIRLYNNFLINGYEGFRTPMWYANPNGFCPNSPPSQYSNVEYVNNMGYNSGNWLFSTQASSGVTFRNNIAYGTGKVTIPSGITQSHNSWNLGITDPKFVNPAAGDFHLQSGSPAIDKGTSAGAPAFDFVGAIRPAGAGFDIGAYEYGSASSCTPNWKCESLLNGYEYDGCGNRRTNSACTSNPTPTCTDGVKNGAETGIDCGGPCAACASNPPSIQITLKPGWNQISSPIAAGIDIATIEANCTILPYKTYKLWAWNAQTQTWINPTKVEPLKGYWIYAAYQCTVPLSGTPATFSSLQLYNGWNKISASGTFSAIQGTCAGRIIGNWLWNWDKATERWIHPATMELNKGYWIKVDQNCVLGAP